MSQKYRPLTDTCIRYLILDNKSLSNGTVSIKDIHQRSIVKEIQRVFFEDILENQLVINICEAVPLWYSIDSVKDILSVINHPDIVIEKQFDIVRVRREDNELFKVYAVVNEKSIVVLVTVT